MSRQKRWIFERSVTRMTAARHLAVVPAGALLALLVSQGCGANALTPSSDYTERPDARDDGSPSQGDAGADAVANTDGAVVVPTPETTCPLKGPPKLGPADTLIFEENFSGTTLDTTRWTLRDGFRRTGVLSYASAANVRVEDGLLRVSATRAASPADLAFPYNAGFVDTLGKWARTYGRIEFRARFPFVEGIWYAIWGRPWSQPFPEIDIEVVNRYGDSGAQLYFVHHWAAPPIAPDLRRSYVLLKEADYSAWHNYVVDWKPGSIAWQVDGVTKMQTTGEHVPTLPMYWMINSWVGGWPGAPTDATPFPTTFDVDWMRVYRTGGVLADPQIRLTVTPKATYSRSESIDVGVANFDEACAHVELHDGADVVWTTSTEPYRAPLSVLAVGSHTLTLVATDGVRNAQTAPFDVVVK